MTAMLQPGAFPVLDFDDDPDDILLGIPPRHIIPDLRRIMSF